MDDRGFRGDQGNKGKGNRNRRDRGFRDPRERRPRPSNAKQDERLTVGTPPTQIKTPIILTKQSEGKSGIELEKSISIKPREEGIGTTHIAGASPAFPQKISKSSIDAPISSGHLSSITSACSGRQQVQRRPIVGSSGGGIDGSDLTALNTTLKCYKIVDDKFHWNDHALEILTDQSDFLVVGVIGCQGVGKSTILSLLANGLAEKDKGSCIFNPQSRQTEELSVNETTGIDMTITNDRIIFLDTQPILNASILDNVIRYERSLPTEVSSAENYAELQSLQITTFLFTVCHVILVVQDWFCDLNVMRFLKTAEMLKPTSGVHSSSHESSSNLSSDEFDEYYPNVMFVYNKCSREDFEAKNIQNMLLVTDVLFQNSRLRIKTSASLPSVDKFPFSYGFHQYADLNLFLVPMSEGLYEKEEKKVNLLNYDGYPNLKVIVKQLRNQIFSMRRHHLTHHQLSEKNWYHFAARSWEMTKKSALLSEYNRLLP